MTTKFHNCLFTKFQEHVCLLVSIPASAALLVLSQVLRNMYVEFCLCHSGLFFPFGSQIKVVLYVIYFCLKMLQTYFLAHRSREKALTASVIQCVACWTEPAQISQNSEASGDQMSLLSSWKSKEAQEARKFVIHQTLQRQRIKKKMKVFVLPHQISNPR